MLLRRASRAVQQLSERQMDEGRGFMYIKQQDCDYERQALTVPHLRIISS